MVTEIARPPTQSLPECPPPADSLPSYIAFISVPDLIYGDYGGMSALDLSSQMRIDGKCSASRIVFWIFDHIDAFPSPSPHSFKIDAESWKLELDQDVCM